MIYKKLDKSEKLQVTLQAAMLDYNWKGIATKILGDFKSDCEWLQLTKSDYKTVWIRKY